MLELYHVVAVKVLYIAKCYNTVHNSRFCEKCTGGLIGRKIPVYEVILANFTGEKTDLLNFLINFNEKGC